ncbi:MAG: hypothetical protein PHY43_11850 [Verrucomicrobiales bacterium]|nr:hypothetical protein [Verrucomicrobiales bacterium]
MSNNTEFLKIVRQRFQRCLTQVKGVKLALTVMAVGLALAAQSLHAANVIQNSGFEANSSYGYFGSGTIPTIPGNWIWGSPGNGGWWMQAYSASGDNNPHSGNNFFKEWGAYQSQVTTNLFYQDNACAVGATFTCDFWQGSTSNAFNGHPDRFSYAYVSFLDSGGNVLALYSAPNYNSNYVGGAWSITNNINWFHFYVTNQNDVVSGAVTGTVSTLTAPAGAHTVRFSWGNWQSASFDGGDFGLDDINLNQTGGPVAPLITQIYPGNMLFASNYISFHVTSATSTPINNSDINLTVDGVAVPNGSISFSGSSPDITVIYNGVSDNAWSHTASITAVDTLGLSAPPQSMIFDTIHPAIVVENEDYDYTNSVSGGGGLYYNNPTPTSTAQANSYFGLIGALGIDYAAGYSGGHGFRTNDSRGLFVTGDYARQEYLDAQVSDPAARDWEIDNIGSGDWGNYTRNYPAGTYNVYARVSGNAGTLTKVSLDTIVGGSVANNVGIFTFTGQGWGVWQYAPLLDNNENLLPISFGGVQTLRATLTPVGGLNENFFFLVPAVIGQPFFSSISPSNGQMFATGNTFSFTVSSPTTINASGISIIMNGVNVTTNPATTITGGTTATASCALLRSNTQYTVVLNVTNAVGAVGTRTVSFDTINSGNFYVKMMDWDFNGGNYDTTGNGLVPYAYAGFNNAITNVDYALGSALNSPYRGPDGLHQEITADAPLPGFTAGADYDVGNFNSGQWANFTRNYPAGKYYVYARFAGYSQSTALSLVTSGVGTTTQTLQALGNFVGNPNGWQTWNWIPLQSGGTPVPVTLGGVQTLRVTSSGNCNANYIMLVPVQSISISAAASGTNTIVSFPSVAVSPYRVFSASSVTGPWSVLQSVTGNGSVVSVTNTTGTGSRFYKVTSP